jgi:hypothetical protein
MIPVARRVRARAGEIVKWVLRIAVIASVALIGRELHVRQTKITAIAGVIDVERDAIDRAETGIDDLERQIGAAADGIGLLDAHITRVEQGHPRGVPPSEYEAYRRLVAERNALADRQNALIARQRLLLEEYGRRVATHNARVADATGLTRRGTPATVVRDLWARLVAAD